jgi:glycosyltransferase involved in cell wall biosynthesis
MQLVILGKFPPIQGGVSSQTYWTAVDLTRRGHEVHVITNGGEVELGFRQFFFGSDSRHLADVGLSGRLHVHTTTPLRAHAFVPWSNPFGSKLLGLALSVIEEYGCDLVFGWYFEPYGVVAAQVAQLCNKPLVIRHAGSDLGRLATHPDLAQTYRWMLRHATSVLSSRRGSVTSGLLAELGVQENKIARLRAARLPEAYSHDCEPLAVDDVLAGLPDWYRDSGMDPRLSDALLRLNSKPLEAGQPTIGVYGKVGQVKGSYSLLAALAQLARSGVDFQFLSISGAPPDDFARYCSAVTSCYELAQRTWILPFLAPWRIPPFLRRCAVVCFLEHGFPIEFHTPLIPREVLASGACLVLSTEIADKQAFSQSLVHRRNVVLVADPSDVDHLSDQLRWLLLGDQAACVVGRHGQYLSETCERFFCQTNSTSDVLERTLTENRPAGVVG